MRNDLDQLIVDTGRHSDDTWKSYRRGTKKSDDPDSDFWNDTHETKARYAKDLSDRLAPLRRFLEGNVGRPFRCVWKEICEHSDNRQIRGHHLREHTLQMVDDNGISKESPRLGRFFYRDRLYVDSNGFLRKGKRVVEKKKKKSNPFIRVVDDLIYCLTEHGWFKTLCIMHPAWNATAAHPLDVYASLPMKRYKGVENYVSWIPLSSTYMVQTDEDKPFRFVKEGKQACKAQWVACIFKQCDKTEIRSQIR